MFGRHDLRPLVAALLLLTSCASPRFDGPKASSVALEGTPKASLADAFSIHPDESGFLLLVDGIEALGARLLMAERAQHGIDAQYYFILDDITGYLFISRLLNAADRGVRVRLLLDDIATGGYERGMAALDGHPHFEIRIFNPFSRRKARVLDGVTDFNRVNRRMHNKSFTVDGLATVVGGRNIGAEYFAARDDMNFGDLDLLAVGPVVHDVGVAFDDYWNSEFAVPVTALVEAPEDQAGELTALRRRIDDALAELVDSRYEAALEATILEQVDLHPEMLTWGPGRVVYDAPEKAEPGTEGEDPEADQLRAPLRPIIQAAESELLVISPYFVPLDRGVEGLCAVRARGVRVGVVTNSLASTDVAAVHAGYAPYRKDLLRCGVELYEARADARVAGAKRAGVGLSQASLHAKGFVVDRRFLFVGSFNWDPRSAAINTEMGILVDSPALAEKIAAISDDGLNARCYRVILNEDGDLRWIGQEGGQEVVLTREPETSFWQRFSVGFMRLLPIRNQL